jgi:GT2 family glycosyltransferase
MDKKRIIIFGAGSLGRKAYNYFGEEKIYCFADNYRFGNELFGKKIISFDELMKIHLHYNVIVAGNEQIESQIEIQCIRHGISVRSFREMSKITWCVDKEERPALLELSIAKAALALVLDNNDYNNNYPQVTLPVFDRSLVSIIIPAYNQWDYTYKCVASVLKHTEIPFEVIIADDNSTDRTQYIGETIKNIVHIRNKENMGFLFNCNNAAKHARCDYILFLNNDTQVQPNWLSSLYELMERDESIGVVGSKFVFPDGSLQEAGCTLCKGAAVTFYGKGNSPLKPDFNYVKEVDYISGASIMVRKALWDKLGGFDERFAPAYCEDVDLAFSVRQMGYKVVYQPKSVVVHFESISYGDIATGEKGRHVFANQQKLYEKWKHVLLAEHDVQGENIFFDRDRSHGKRVILCIENSVPTKDEERAYLKLLVEMGYHVIFMPADFLQNKPYSYLPEQMGVMVLYGDFYKDDWKKWIEDNGMYIDYVWLNCTRTAERFMDVLKLHTNAKIIYNGEIMPFSEV